MTVTTESGGRQNIYSTEPRPYIDESVSYEGYPQNAEKVNGRWAMIGFVHYSVHMQQQDKSFRVYSNELLERSRANKWSSCDGRFLCTRS